jgi:hypothetical protein
LPLRLGVGFVAAGALATVAIYLLPGGDGETPPESTLVGVAAAVAAVTGVALFAGLRLDLGLPVSIALYAVAYNLLVVLVKFVLGPWALYDASESGKVTVDFGGDGAALFTAAAVGLLYLLAFWLLYRLARRRLERGPPRWFSSCSSSAGSCPCSCFSSCSPAGSTSSSSSPRRCRSPRVQRSPSPWRSPALR